MNIYEKHGYTAFKTYCALKAHLKGQYDYFARKGRLRTSPEAFLKRPDKDMFFIMSKWGNEMPQFILANLVDDVERFSGDFKKEPLSRYNRILSDLENEFDRQLDLIGDLQESIEYKDGSSRLFKLYMSRKVHIETITIINKIFGCVPYWRDKLNPILYADTLTVIEKYYDFLDIDLKLYKQKIINKNRVG